jgi:hypothetical protein
MLLLQMPNIPIGIANAANVAEIAGRRSKKYYIDVSVPLARRRHSLREKRTFIAVYRDPRSQRFRGVTTLITLHSRSGQLGFDHLSSAALQVMTALGVVQDNG